MGKRNIPGEGAGASLGVRADIGIPMAASNKHQVAQ